jgi:hypothetical protein
MNNQKITSVSGALVSIDGQDFLDWSVCNGPVITFNGSSATGSFGAGGCTGVSTLGPIGFDALGGGATDLVGVNFLGVVRLLDVVSVVFCGLHMARA